MTTQTPSGRRLDSGASNPLHPTNLSILSELLRQSCLELMTDYGLSPELKTSPHSVAPVDATLMAAIDFSGKDVRGTVALRVTRSVIAETYRAASGSILTSPAGEFEDWTCELANQLLGRLKNKLRRYDVSFTINMPRLIMALPVAELEHAICDRFMCDRGAFAGYLDVLVAPGFVFDDQPSNDVVAEGDLVLF